MEHSHMLASRRRPQAQPGDDPGVSAIAIQHETGSAAPAADASMLPVRQAPQDQLGHQQKRSGDFSAHANTALSLQLPPLALSMSGHSTTELPPIQASYERSAGVLSQTLPPLSSVTGSQVQRHAPLPQPTEPSHPAPSSRVTNHWPSLNPFTTYYSPSYLEPGESSPSMDSERSGGRRAASVSLDDPDVRIAAEALGQMRTDFVSSPRNQTTPLASTRDSYKTSRDDKANTHSPESNGRGQPDSEPLLSLITTSHPLLATTIEGAASAYNSGKNYSPHLKTGAEYVESCLNPVAKAVGNVGRKTGVEGGVRWIFGIRNKKQPSSSDLEVGERGRNKRRKSERDDKARNVSITSGLQFGADGEDRRMSISTVDTLPAYDDQRSPAYTEVAEGQAASRPGGPGTPTQPWGQRLVVTTSGLGVAMKQESLRSLKYCLRVVKDTNGHINDVLLKLKGVIEEYDLATQKDGEDHAMEDGQHSPPHTAADRRKLISSMNELRDDIFRAIHRTVQTVSKYAGSALPENARNLVHRQLMSLPGLYQLHYMRESPEGRRGNANPEAMSRDSAHLALLFAKEALQMMTQVGDVLNRTVVSAEEWCEALYRKDNEQAEQAESPLGGTESSPVPPPPAMEQAIGMSA